MNRLTSLTSVKSAWAATLEDVLSQLKTDKSKGLSDSDVRKRRDVYGPNVLKSHKKKSLWQILFDQVKSLIILLLAVAAIVSFLYDQVLEGWAIMVVLIINTAIGFFTEWRAIRSMEALFELGRVETRVRRNGKVKKVDAEELVPGDIVLFEGGDIITADIRILDSSKLQADESALTGESMPVSKESKRIPENTVLAERSSMLYKGTAITRGSGEGVVVSTGQDTELGHISSLVEGAEEERTPLEDRLDQLGYKLILLTLVLTVFISVSGILSGKGVFLMVETGIALAVAAIPEGLPIVATLALAKGIQILARKNALINRLSSVETLGSTDTIFTDKTGTLTENRMSVNTYFLANKKIEVDSDIVENYERNQDLRLAIETGILCNNASLSHENDGKGSGDPLEQALLKVGREAGIDHLKFLKSHPEIREEAFDAEVKMMSTWNEVGDGRYRISVKGAPDEVLRHCSTYLENGEHQLLKEEQKNKWLQKNEELAASGLRVIALALRESESADENPYHELTFIGLAGLLDPPRKEVKNALNKCKEAGIHVVMVTGDQPRTAEYIARSVGLAQDGKINVIHGNSLHQNGQKTASAYSNKIMEANIFARISPEQKLDLIEAYQKNGHIVGMTGDGVNDAPALKKADIGIAMGKRGTQVAQEASDMVLLDDAFSTIVTAIEQGRTIFRNIRRFVYYLLSCNVSEVMVVGAASLAGAPIPILPLQILFLNLVTDVFPALALGVGEEKEEIIKDAPRKINEPILVRAHWWGILGYGLLISAIVMGALFLGLHYLGLEKAEAVTLSFLTLAFAQLWHVFNMRNDGSNIFKNSITQNKWVWIALVLCVVLIMGALLINPVAQIMHLSFPDAKGWAIVLVMSSIPLFVGQIKKQLGSK